MTGLAFLEKYHEVLVQGLTQCDFVHSGNVPVADKIANVDASISIDQWRCDGRIFFMSNGCSAHPGKNQNWRDEFIIEQGSDSLFSQKLLEYVIYYHLTRRPILPADVLAIGEMRENIAGYSHVYVSVPFFLPGSVNVIPVGETNVALDWLMPIFQAEADYIQSKGAEAFEAKLNFSPYDFFDTRSDLSYLD